MSRSSDQEYEGSRHDSRSWWKWQRKEACLGLQRGVREEEHRLRYKRVETGVSEAW